LRFWALTALWLPGLARLDGVWTFCGVLRSFVAAAHYSADAPLPAKAVASGLFWATGADGVGSFTYTPSPPLFSLLYCLRISTFWFGTLG